MNFKLSLIASIFLLSACGGGGEANTQTPNIKSSQDTSTSRPYKPTAKVSTNENFQNIVENAKITSDYSNLPVINIPKKTDIATRLNTKTDTATISVFAKLYDTNLSTFQSANNPSNYSNKEVSRSNNNQTSYGFSPNWNQGFLGKGIIIGVNDSGTDDLKNVLVNKHFDYKKTNQTKWNSLANRIDDDNFISKNYSNSILKDSNNSPILHGKNVMNTANTIASEIKFANIVNPISKSEIGDDINLAATIDALSNSGVRFFNQSYEYSNLDYSSPNTGIFYTAIMKNNALVFNAAGNITDNINKPFTTHAIPLDSPLRKGWVIVLGYKTNAARVDEYGKHFYIQDNDGAIKEVFHHGNTCKKNGWDDCISAPFEINGVEGTSYSTPITASVAALIYEKYPWMSNDNIKESLFTTAFKVTSTTNNADDIKARFGVGILNPTRAMNGVAEFRKDFYANVDLDNLYVFSNNIKGDFGLIKDGIGTLVLSGDNTFKGNSEIKNGTLWLTGKKNQAHFTNTNGVLRVSNTTASGITNNSVLINEGLTLGSLELGANSKIYSNLGESFRVLGNAKLDGEFNLVGVKSGANITQGQNVDILTARSIENRFKSVQSLVTFLEINEPTYTNNKVSVMVKRIDLNKINNLNDFASKNYQLLFNQLDNYLEYEVGKRDKTSDDLAYNNINLDGYLSEAEYNLRRADLFYASILNTTQDELAKNTNKLFANDLYDNSLMNIAKVKSIQANDLKDDFNIEQSYKYNKINSLKESSNETLISNALIKDDFKFALGFVYNNSNIYNDDFKNNARTLGLIANANFNLDDFYINNKLSYINTLNKTERFGNYAKFYDNSLAYTLKFAYKLNDFYPFVALNGIFYTQNSFNALGNDFSVSVNSFKKFFTYSNIGLEYKKNLNYLNLLAGVDLEYNFYKHYLLKAKNISYQNSIDISNGFSKKLLTNINLGLGYSFNDRLNLGINYKLNYAKDYFANKFMLGINYNF
ncbi:S8 family serine peptidase [Campylobacter sp. 2018MI01]|uniref:S8 family serine peptidase n=1 Tax=Campylobacter sp. 2018MI01 TaxID=2836735 RepID=UPI001BD9D68E|nr:S8 family serine peptidase [Campylobacter sp. 2018MI01]MBT0879353.1 S8 family serine peptidase [Campylobacter sp. 2018MI01]